MPHPTTNKILADFKEDADKMSVPGLYVNTLQLSLNNLVFAYEKDLDALRVKLESEGRKKTRSRSRGKGKSSTKLSEADVEDIRAKINKYADNLIAKQTKQQAIESLKERKEKQRIKKEERSPKKIFDSCMKSISKLGDNPLYMSELDARVDEVVHQLQEKISALDSDSVKGGEIRDDSELGAREFKQDQIGGYIIQLRAKQEEVKANLQGSNESLASRNSGGYAAVSSTYVDINPDEYTAVSNQYAGDVTSLTSDTTGSSEIQLPEMEEMIIFYNSCVENIANIVASIGNVDKKILGKDLEILSKDVVGKFDEKRGAIRKRLQSEGKDDARISEDHQIVELNQLETALLQRFIGADLQIGDAPDYIVDDAGDVIMGDYDESDAPVESRRSSMAATAAAALPKSYDADKHLQVMENLQGEYGVNVGMDSYDGSLIIQGDITDAVSESDNPCLGEKKLIDALKEALPDTDWKNAKSPIIITKADVEKLHEKMHPPAPQLSGT